MAIGTTNYPAALDDATSLIRLVNLASSTIDTGGVTNVATTVPVVSAASAPADGVAWCGTEAIAYTGKTGTTLTGCTRGFDGTTAASHAAGDPIYFDPVIASRFDVLQDAIIATQTALGIQGRNLGAPVFNIAKYGATLDGTTNDATVINTAITTAAAAGGGDVVIPAGKTAAISASITLVNSVRLVLGQGAILKWTGSAGGTMITSGSSDPLQRSGVIGGMLNPNSASNTAGYVFHLHSPQYCELGPFEILAGSATTVLLRIASDATNASGVAGTRNAAYNWIHDLVGNTCGVGIELDGQNTPTVGITTLNTFHNIEIDDCRSKAVRIVKWTDNNVFSGMQRYGIAANSAVGVILNDAGAPASDVGVYANHWMYLAVDAFGTFTGRVGIQINKSKWCRVENFHCDPEPEGGAIVADAATDSYQVGRTGKVGDIGIYDYRKAVYLQNPLAFDENHWLGFSGSNPMWLVDANDAIDFVRGFDVFEFIIGSVFAAKLGPTGLWVYRELIVNEDGGNYDTRIEGDTDQNLFFVDASADSIGIGTATPTSWLDLKAGTTARAPLRMPAGALLTTPIAGVMEYTTEGFFFTSNTTNGRADDNSQQVRKLTANSGNIGATIADYFAANSGIPTIASANYEIIWYLHFTKNTAGTVTFTITSSTAPTRVKARYLMTPVGGIGAVGAPQTAGIHSTTSTTAVLPVTGSLTNGTDHYAEIRCNFTANTAGNVRLRVTESAGTITPLADSYFTVRRIPVDTGTFVA